MDVPGHDALKDGPVSSLSGVPAARLFRRHLMVLEKECQARPLEEVIAPFFGGKAPEGGERERFRHLFTFSLADKGDRLLKKGEKARSFQVIVCGKVALSAGSGDEEPVILSADDHLGGISLLYDTPMTADCTVLEETSIYWISRDDFFRYIAVDEKAADRIKGTSKDAVEGVDLSLPCLEDGEKYEKESLPVEGYEEKTFRKLLHRVSFGKYLQNDELPLVFSLFRRLNVKKGTLLLEAGKNASHFFLIASGKVKSRILDRKGKELLAAQHGRGDFFAEDSLLSHSPLETDYVAEENCIVYIVRKKDFFNPFLLTRPDVEDVLRLSASDRKENFSRLLAERTRKEGLVPLDREDLPLLEETLDKVEFSELLSRGQRDHLATVFRKIEIKKGTKIYGRGKVSTAFLIVARGMVLVTGYGEEGAGEEEQLVQGSYFGEEGLLLKRPRSADFIAGEDVVLFHLPAQNFHKYLCVNRDLEKILREKAECRLSQGYGERVCGIAESWIEAGSMPLSEKYHSLYEETLDKFEFSKYLKSREIQNLRNYFRIYPARKGNAIIKSGTNGEYFFILARGGVEIRKYDRDGEIVVLGELGEGDYFGELSLLNDIPREATYVASGSCLLLCLHKEYFLDYFLANSLVKQFISRNAREKSVMRKPSARAPRARQAVRKVSGDTVFLSPDQEAAMNTLAWSPFIRFLRKETTKELIEHMEIVQYSPGMVVAPDETRWLNFISSGAVVVTDGRATTTLTKVQQLMPGEFFGENELLEENPLPRKYLASGMTVLFRVSRDVLFPLLERDWALNFYIRKSAAVKNNQWKRAFPGQVLPEHLAGSGGAARSLAETFAFLLRHGSALVLVLDVMTTEARQGIFLFFASMARKIGDVSDFLAKNVLIYMRAASLSSKESVDELMRRVLPLKKMQCHPMELLVFTRQMGVMIESGLPLVRVFSVLGKQTADRNLAFALRSIEADVVYKGLPLSVGMKRFPSMFNDFYTGLVRSGEVGGKLSKAFVTCSTFLERDMGLKRKLSAAMTYPFTIMGAAIMLILGIVLFIMPTFVTLFEEMNMTLPFATKIMIIVVKGICNPVVDLVALALLAWLGFTFRAYYNTVQGREAVDMLLAQVMVLGDLIRKVSITRFSWSLASLVNSGVSVVESLQTAERVVTNQFVRRQLEKCRLLIIKGKSLAQAFTGVDIVPRMFKDMVAVGEETGNLDTQLRKVGDFYDAEVVMALETFMSLLEPLMVVFMGIVVGFILLGLFLPIYQFAQNL